MLYKVVLAQIQNDGSIKEGKRKLLHQTPHELDVGGLYFLKTGKLYRVLEKICN